MSTNSVIGAMFEEGVVGSSEIVFSYCHYDGYLTGVGLQLLEQYNDADRAFEVADGGYLSSLPDYDELNESSHANSDASRYAASELEFLDLARRCGGQFVYLWKNGEWFYAEYSYNSKEWSALLPVTMRSMIPELKHSLNWSRENPTYPGAKEMEEYYAAKLAEAEAADR